jgi:AcrR family transcriptional regulator
MARALNVEKRTLILEKAKELFADAGFAPTTVADVAAACEVPVGSIYTYFKNKEEIVRAIVDEGWDDLRTRLVAELHDTERVEDKLELLVGRFLPELFADSNLITILLSEAVDYTGLEEKINEIVTLFEQILKPVMGTRPELQVYNRATFEAALLVYFLGTLDAVRLARTSSLDVTTEDIIEFLRLMIRNSLGLEL